MAEVTEDQQKIRERIDRMLYYSKATWEELPQVESEIDSWDLMDQLTYIEGWPPNEEQLKWLERYAQEGHMAKDQLARYEELKELVAKNRPIIRRLQNS